MSERCLPVSPWCEGTEMPACQVVNAQWNEHSKPGEYSHQACKKRAYATMQQQQQADHFSGFNDQATSLTFLHHFSARPSGYPFVHRAQRSRGQCLNPAWICWWKAFAHCHTFRTTAPPVEWPRRKQGTPGFSIRILSTSTSCFPDKNVNQALQRW